MFVVDSEHDKYDCNSLQADQLVYILLVMVLMGGDNTGSYRKISGLNVPSRGSRICRESSEDAGGVERGFKATKDIF